MNNGSFYMANSLKWFFLFWVAVPIVMIVLDLGPFVISYLPSSNELHFLRTVFPFFLFLFLILPFPVSKIARKLGMLGSQKRKLPNPLSILIMFFLFSFLLSWASSGIMAFPTLIFGTRETSAIELVHDISGFRRNYSSKSWVAVGDGLFPRRFLWSTQDLSANQITTGSCIRLSGETLGMGLVPEKIKKAPCN